MEVAAVVKTPVIPAVRVSNAKTAKNAMNAVYAVAVIPETADAQELSVKTAVSVKNLHATVHVIAQSAQKAHVTDLYAPVAASV